MRLRCLWQTVERDRKGGFCPGTFKPHHVVTRLFLYCGCHLAKSVVCRQYVVRELTGYFSFGKKGTLGSEDCVGECPEYQVFRCS